MSIGTPVGFGAAATSPSTPAQATLPTISQDGVVLVVVSSNSGSGTEGTPTGAAATWTADSQNVSGSTLEGTLFYANVTSADSGDTLSSALGTNRRWTMGGLYIPGARITNIVVAQDNSAASTTSVVYPGITPVGTQKWVALGVHRNNTTSPGSVTATGSGWNEYTDASTSIGTAPQFLVWAHAKDDTLISSGQSTITVNGATQTGTKISWSVTLEEIPGSGATGTLAATLDGVTLAASATETFTGTLATTLADATLAATGAAGASGTLASTLDGATLAGSGTELFTGTLATTLDGATLAASAAQTVTGTLAATLDGATLAGAGATGASGTLATTLDGATLAGFGVEAFAGTLATTLDEATLAADGVAGEAPIDGELATTLDDVTLAAAGTETISGTLATTLAGVTLSAAGEEQVSGSAASTLDGATLDATGLQTITGTLSATLDGATLAALAEQEMAGVLEAVLDGATLGASGSVGVAPEARNIDVVAQGVKALTATYGLRHFAAAGIPGAYAAEAAPRETTAQPSLQRLKAEGVR